MGYRWLHLSRLSVSTLAKAFNELHCWSSGCRLPSSGRLGLRGVGTAASRLRCPLDGVLPAGGALRGH